LIDSTT